MFCPTMRSECVIPAKAGIQLFVYYRFRDSRFRGNDGFRRFLLIVGQARCSVPTKHWKNI